MGHKDHKHETHGKNKKNPNSVTVTINDVIVALNQIKQTISASAPGSWGTNFETQVDVFASAMDQNILVEPSRTYVSTVVRGLEGEIPNIDAPTETGYINQAIGSLSSSNNKNKHNKNKHNKNKHRAA